MLLASLAATEAQQSRGRQLSYTPIVSYAPGSQVTDHSRIDLDQAAIQTELAGADFIRAKLIYDNGVYSKPSSVCTFNEVSLTAVPTSISKGTKVYFETESSGWVEGKAYTNYEGAWEAGQSFTFTYPVADLPITYEYGTGPVDPGDVCWMGDLPAESYATGGCLRGSLSDTDLGRSESTIVIGGTGCATGDFGGFSTCNRVEQLRVSCSNQGKRTLKGFSTAAKAKMYDPTLSSKDCPDSSVPPQSTKGYPNGCPYTSYEPYWDYYCSSIDSPCHEDGDYANAIISSALLQDDSAVGLTMGGMNFTSVAVSGRREMIKKGTAYMSAWMYAIREFEDAIDDCTAGSLTANIGSSGPVHAWDEGVAFYVGSAMSVDDIATGNLPTLDDKGFLAYTLANKRCQNFKTCGPDGDATVGEAKVNRDLWDLFAAGRDRISVGDCAAAVPIKNDIVKKMTVPLVQGTLRYAYKQSTTTASDGPKEQGEGAIFAAGVLPQVYNCSADAASTIYTNMNINNRNPVDFNAVKTALESCYAAMGITCAEVGGLYSTSSMGYYMDTGAGATPPNPDTTYDATPCTDAPPDPCASGPTLFFSLFQESVSRFGQYFQIFNPTSADIYIGREYTIVMCLDECNNGAFEYEQAFPNDAIISAGGSYTVCSTEFEGAADCDQLLPPPYLSHNGNDFYGLVRGSGVARTFTVDDLVDQVGVVSSTPVESWPVCGQGSGMDTANGLLKRLSSSCCGASDGAAFAPTFLGVCDWMEVPESQSVQSWEPFGTCSPGPVRLMLTVTEIVQGAPVVITVTGGVPNQQTIIVYSLEGPGTSYLPAAAVTTGLASYIQYPEIMTTDSSGSATWTFPVPSGAPVGEVWVQAFQERLASNVVASRISEF